MARTEIDTGAASHLNWHQKYSRDRRSLRLALSQQWRDQTAQLAAFAYTLYLFTKSDIKTILIPVTVFGAVSAPSRDPRSLLLTAIWVWLNLLQCDVSNQSTPGSAAEDAANKPWRPIPAGRLTIDTARMLRWALLLICLAVSCAWGATIPGIALAVLFWGYSELGCDSAHWSLKNAFNALGYGAFNLGATCVASGGSFDVLSSAAIPHALAALVILTTVQMQDFQDAVGDAARGRSTLALAFPRASRTFTALAVPAWALVLSAYSHLSPMAACAFVALGMFVGARFQWDATEAGDRRSYVYYNVWLCFAQVVPLIR